MGHGMELFLILALMIFGLTVTMIVRRAWRRAARLDAVRNHPFPHGLREALHNEYPQLAPADLSRVLDGLRQYLEVCARARLRTVAMPSRVVDAAWHHFILYTHAYAEFCARAFGRFLHHTPTAAMADARAANVGLRRCWHIACAIENIDPLSPQRLPLLFALDGDLAIADGFHYELDCRADARRSGTESNQDIPRHCATHLASSGGCGGGSWYACAGACGSNGTSDGGSGCGGGGCGGGGCGGGGD